MRFVSEPSESVGFAHWLASPVQVAEVDFIDVGSRRTKVAVDSTIRSASIVSILRGFSRKS